MLENDNVLFQQHQILTGKLPGLIQGLFLFLIAVVIGAVAIANWVWLNLAVNATGMIRPAKEKTEVRAFASGLLDTIFVLEGQNIHKGDTIALLKDAIGNSLQRSLEAERSSKVEQLADLDLLLEQHLQDTVQIKGLHSALYRQEFAQFLQDWGSKRIQGQQTANEYAISRRLMEEKIIAKAEYDVKETAFRHQAALEKAFWFARQAAWSTDRQRIRQDLENLEQKSLQLQQSREQLILPAPVDGVVMGIREHYTNGLLQTGEILCVITPNDSLIAECMVSPGEIGFLRIGQPVNFRIDAFDHQQFGTIKGKVIEIDQDFTSLGSHPVFRVRCSLQAKSLRLRIGYSAALKKGMTVQARFIIARRTIWQICFDQLQNWLDPNISI